MMVIFFLGIGASSAFCSFADTPFEIGLGLTLIGSFAAIYHPVGLSMLIQGRDKLGMPLAINGIFGNMGVASAALLTGLLIDTAGWRSSFLIPGIASMILGMLYLVFEYSGRRTEAVRDPVVHESTQTETLPRNTLIRIFCGNFLHRCGRRHHFSKYHLLATQGAGRTIDGFGGVRDTGGLLYFPGVLDCGICAAFCGLPHRQAFCPNSLRLGCHTPGSLICHHDSTDRNGGADRCVCLHVCCLRRDSDQ